MEICLGTKKLKLHIDRLRKTCDYFQSFNNVDVQEASPIRFCLPTNADDDTEVEKSVDDSSVVIPCTHADSHDHTADGNEDVSATNEALFRLLYDQPLKLEPFTTAETFRDTAALAVHYGCLPVVKPLLVTAILKASLGTGLFSYAPMELLTAAYHLRDEFRTVSGRSSRACLHPVTLSHPIPVTHRRLPPSNPTSLAPPIQEQPRTLASSHLHAIWLIGTSELQREEVAHSHIKT